LAEQDGPVSEISALSPSAPLPRSAAPETACKICAAASPLFDVVDFHKNCHEPLGTSLRLSGRPVYYYRCPDCGFLFTRSFDAWRPEEFSQSIYNGDYQTIDPDYAEVRPRHNANTLQSLFGERLKALRLLDFGGGNGGLAKLLRESGCAADSFDPFGSDGAVTLPAATDRYDVVTAFEVFEHVADPVACLTEIDRLLKPDGLLLISTRINDGKEGKASIGPRLTWWYASPRNGHIALHSRRSLRLLLWKFGFHCASLGDDCHFGFRQVPAFASHMIKPS
jgi:2-polyprenyl-6-hydroxyphenyl methylase/3-demethylubiquinone-9 3-methyltransferase